LGRARRRDVTFFRFLLFLAAYVRHAGLLEIGVKTNERILSGPAIDHNPHFYLLPLTTSEWRGFVSQLYPLKVTSASDGPWATQGAPRWRVPVARPRRDPPRARPSARLALP